MTKQAQIDSGHVGEMLSGYIDGELTQQERQHVTLHCEQCERCRKTFEELTALRERLGNARISVIGEDKWREKMDDKVVKTSLGIGWVLVIGGLLAMGGVGLYHFVIEDSMAIWQKLIIVAIYGGLAALLFSVLRQRLIERKTDKYKDVEI